MFDKDNSTAHWETHVNAIAKSRPFRSLTGVFMILPENATITVTSRGGLSLIIRIAGLNEAIEYGYTEEKKRDRDLEILKVELEEFYKGE